MFILIPIQILFYLLLELLMWIVAVAWIYVVLLMALTEPSVVSGIMTFLLYCMLPLGILFYLTGSKARKRKRDAQANQRENPPST
jgi:membrane protein implicated in regulation of membrane protease activity